MWGFPQPGKGKMEKKVGMRVSEGEWADGRERKRGKGGEEEREREGEEEGGHRETEESPGLEGLEGRRSRDQKSELRLRWLSSLGYPGPVGERGPEAIEGAGVRGQGTRPASSGAIIRLPSAWKICAGFGKGTWSSVSSKSA